MMEYEVASSMMLTAVYMHVFSYYNMNKNDIFLFSSFQRDHAYILGIGTNISRLEAKEGHVF